MKTKFLKAKQRKLLKLIMSAVFLVIVGACCGTMATAVTIIVNTTNNVSSGSGQTNLVQAISLLRDGDAINFNIPGSGVQYLLTPPGGYPLITNNNITIDGYSQPGAAPNTNSIHAANNAQIKIVLDSRNGNGMSMRAAVQTAAGVSYGNLGYDYTELATLGFFRGSNAIVRGLAFVSAATATDTVRGYYGQMKTLSFCPDSLEVGGPTANCANWRVSGCWFGVNPATGQLAYMPDGVTVAIPLICIAAYGTENNDGSHASMTFPWPATIGVAKNSASPRADFNVIISGYYGLDASGHDFRISGNFWSVLPDGMHNWDPVQAGLPVVGGAFIEIGGDNSNLTIGTDGDGVNDADEGNVFGGVANYAGTAGSYAGGYVGLFLYGQDYIPTGGHGTNCVLAGNYFGVAVDGVTRFTNSLVLVQRWVGGSSGQAATVRFGSDFDGVSDALEANVVYNNYPFAATFPNPSGSSPPTVFDGTSTPYFGVLNAGVQLSFRGNVTVGNDLLPFKYANGQGTLLTAFANYEAPYMITTGSIIPTLNTLNNFPNLSGTFAPGIAPYTNIILDVYQLDPEAWANGKLFAEPELINSITHTTNGFPQGQRYVGSFTVPNTGSFNVVLPTGTCLSGALTLTVNYSADPPGTHNGRVHTGNFSNPGYLALIDTDIGDTGAAGSLGVTNCVYTVRGSGQGIVGTGDIFNFAYQPMTGDGMIVARLAAMQPPNLQSQAGVMMRDGLDSGARHVFLGLDASTNMFLTRRLVAAANSIENSLPGTNVSWLRLTRVGNIFIGHVSTDGANWSYAWATALNLPSQIDVGLAVTADNYSYINTVEFDNLAIGAATPLPGAWPLPAPEMYLCLDVGTPAAMQNVGGLPMLVGGVVGDQYSIKCSTNAAASFASWPSLGTVTNTWGVVTFLDSQAPTNRLRFYRAQRTGP